MNIRVSPGLLSGTWQGVPSKSHGHRLLFSAALSGNLGRGIKAFPPSPMSEDILATIDCMETLTNAIGGKSTKPPVFDCRESGTTLRFLIPLAMALFPKAQFIRKGRLATRPLSPLREEMEAKGCVFQEDGPVLTISGQLCGGNFSLAGNVSSQFISGLLLALPLTDQGGTISLTTPLESAPYVDMTLETLREFQVKIEEGPNSYTISPGQTYIAPNTCHVEGDWSNSAFFATANYLGSTISIKGLNNQSSQGDKAILDLLNQREIDVSQVPDLVPILAVKAALTPGKTTIYNAARLRIKESDRLAAMASNLKTLGVQVVQGDDSLTIEGSRPQSPRPDTYVQGFNDHRIVMAMAIFAAHSTCQVTIEGAQAVSKSYPDFFKDFKDLGGIIHDL